jgi:nucleotide-binding universal stress UspA family protein
VHEAAARHAALRIVCAYQSPPPLAHDAYIDASMWDFRQVAHAAQSAAAQAAAYVRPLEESVGVSSSVREGDPVTVLLEESGRAQLRVVGSRRYDGIHGRVLGSVSSAVAARAACGRHARPSRTRRHTAWLGEPGCAPPRHLPPGRNPQHVGRAR